MNTNGWIEHLYVNEDLLDKKTKEILEMKKTKTWSEIGGDLGLTSEGARNQLYRVYKKIIKSPDYYKQPTMSLEDIAGVIESKKSVGHNVDNKIKSFAYLGAEKILEIGLSNTRGLTIEFVHQRTGIPKKIIDANLGKYTASEIIAEEELFCSQKCINSQVKYGGSSLL